MRRSLVTASLAALALAAAGCGGSSSTGSASKGASGAEIVPASAPIFISVNSDLDSDQWKKVMSLADKFPGKAQALQSMRSDLQEDGVDFERDIKPALGDEVDVAVLSLAPGRSDEAVVITKPKDEKKLNAALSKGDDPAYHTKIDDWTVYAESQALLDRFERQSDKADKHLSDLDRFKDATADQPDETVAKFYVNGNVIQQALANAAMQAGPGVDTNVLNDLGAKADWIGGSLVSADDGTRLEAAAKTNQKIATYKPSLTGALPAGALAVISFNNLDQGMRQGLKAASQSDPNFQRQQQQTEQALGFSIQNDVLPLFSGEGAVALYPPAAGATVPTIDVLLKVKDEQKAQRLLDRVGALAGLGGNGGATPVQIGGLSAKRLTLPNGMSLFYATFDGKLAVSTGQSGLAGIHGGGKKLADDPLFTEARDNAKAADDSTGFMYANLQTGLPLVYEQDTSSSPAELEQIRANTKPLRAVYIGSSKDGDTTKLDGFLTIK